MLPWIIAAVSYIGARIMCAVWITDGGTHNTRVPRWKIFVVCIFWLLIMIWGLTERFVEWFFKGPQEAE